MRSGLAPTVVGIALILHSFVAVADSGADRGTLIGQVVAGSSARALAGANVEIIEGPEMTATMTDADGHFSIQLLPGTYTLRATYIGYGQEPLETVTVTSGETAAVTFHKTSIVFELDQIVVSASKHEESVIDAPASITKVDWAKVAKSPTGHSYVSELKEVKGIHHMQQGILLEKFNARGFNSANNSRMMLIVDGRLTVTSAPNPLNNSPISKNDFADMEVIVGPASSLYGPDAVAGVVSLRSKDPRLFPGTDVALSMGTRSLLKTRFRHANSNGKWGWKIASELQRASDFETARDFYSPDSSLVVTEMPDFDTDILRTGVGLFRYLDEESKWSFNSGWARFNQVFPINAGVAQVKNITYNYQQVMFESPQLYANLYRAGDDSGDSYLLDTEANVLLAGAPPSVARQEARVTGGLTLYEGELRYSIPLPTRNTIVNIGGNIRQDRVTSNFVIGEKVNQSQFGIYGHAEADLEKRLRLILATRLDAHEEYDVQFSPKAGLVFKPVETAALRLTLNRAYKSPTVNDLHFLLPLGPPTVLRGNGNGFEFASLSGEALPPEFAAGIESLQPERNTTIELGYKAILRQKAYVDLSVYRSKYKDFISPPLPMGDFASGIVTVDDAGNPREEVTLSSINFGKQTVIGLDLAANVRIDDRLTVWGNSSFIDARTLHKSSGIAQPFNTPETILNLGATTRDIAMEGTYFDVSLRHVSGHDFRSGPHIGFVPAYSAVDGSVGLRAKNGVGYRLSATNLLGNEHREFVTGPEIGRILALEAEYAF